MRQERISRLGTGDDTAVMDKNSHDPPEGGS
jgi:hypothetical protein